LITRDIKYYDPIYMDSVWGCELMRKTLKWLREYEEFRFAVVGLRG
jgi:hypothetical protein